VVSIFSFSLKTASLVALQEKNKRDKSSKLFVEVYRILNIMVCFIVVKRLLD
jgi:hypothetical protein